MAVNPTAIFFAGYDGLGSDAPEVLAALTSSPLWSELDAVKNDRVYSIDSWTFSGSSGLILLSRAMDESMAMLYPDIFPEPLTDEEVAEILAKQ